MTGVIVPRVKHFYDMTMYSKILVPLDGSQLAEKALTHALEVARGQSRVQLYLLRCWEMDLFYPIGVDDAAEADFSNQLRDNIEDYLQNKADSLSRDGLTVITVAEEGESAGVILSEARGRGIDLIVMSSHGRSGISRWLMGSVADKVVRHAPCPVLIVGRAALQPEEEAPTDL